MGRESVLRALKQLGKDRSDFDKSFEALAQAITGPDRTVIIVQAAMVEDRLQGCLIGRMSHLNKAEIDVLFGIAGPLSSFSAKISIAYAMNVIDKSIYQDLHVIRLIRNAMAHKAVDVSFKTKDIANACKLLHAPQHLPNRPIPDQIKDDSKYSDAKRFFQVSCMLLQICFNIQQRKQKYPLDYSASSTLLEVIFKDMDSKTE